MTCICRKVNCIFLPSGNACQITLERCLVSATICRDEHFSGTTGRVLPPESKISILIQHQRRHSQHTGIPSGIIIRIKTDTLAVMTGSIIAPRSGSCTFRVIPSCRNSCSKRIEILAERYSKCGSYPSRKCFASFAILANRYIIGSTGCQAVK